MTVFKANRIVYSEDNGFCYWLSSKIITITFVAIITFFAPCAASAEISDSVAVEVFFPVGKTAIIPDFKANGERLQAFIDQLKKRKIIDTKREEGAEGNSQISRVYISGYTSPEGPEELNRRLGRNRAECMADFLRSQANIPDSLFCIRYTGIDWQGLSRAVEASTLNDKAKVLEIISGEKEPATGRKGRTRSRQQQLMSLDGGRTWSWLLENVFPQLRSSASVVCYFESLPLEEATSERAATVEPADTASADEVVEPATETAIDSLAFDTKEATDDVCRYTVFALRSNALLPLMNIGAEVPIGNRWSVGGDYYYPWQWRKSDHKNCFQLTFFSGEVRYWFGKMHSQAAENRANRLLGHSIAAYGAWGYYDFEHNYHGQQGDFWSAGLDYVYAIPILKDRLHMEFQFAAGVIRSKSQPYDVFFVGGDAIRDRLSKKKFSYVGPTKIGVSFVLPINVRAKKQ